jgi:clan AA aspartic protease
MIIGVVDANLEPRLLLTVRAASLQSHEVEVVIDTGFNGFLTLPPALIAALGLPWLCRQQGELADGSILVFDVYVAAVDWDGQPRSVEVEAADSQPLLGMALMQGSDLHMQVLPGGSVAITALP